MATLTRTRLNGLFRPKPAPKPSKRIYEYANDVYKKSGGATPELVEVYKRYLVTQKKT